MPTSSKTDLHIPFKGERTYLQGGDLFDAAFEVAAANFESAVSDFEISFHDMSTSGVTMVLEAEDIDSNTAQARGNFTIDGERFPYFLVSNGVPAAGRVPFPEEELVEKLTFDFDEQCAVLSEPSPYTPMETWVSMIKALHQRLIDDRDGKWIFVRAKIKGYDPKASPKNYCVKLATRLGHKLTRNEVWLDGEQKGEVFFSLLTEDKV